MPNNCTSPFFVVAYDEVIPGGAVKFSLMYSKACLQSNLLTIERPVASLLKFCFMSS